MQRRLTYALLAITLLAMVVPLGPAPVNDPAYAQAGLPALPAGWPGTLQLGRGDGAGGAASMRAKAPFGFRYQYLAGGVNTGLNGENRGWSSWNTPPGQFVNYYVDESVAQGMTPVFTYYMIFQSNPGNPAGEQEAVLGNLNNLSTMQAYWADLRLFFERAHLHPNTRIVLHVEPDMWGYVQQVASGDNAASVPAQVSNVGMSELNGLPNNVAGLAQGIVRLRNAIAPNVTLGYHVSVWGTGIDIALSDPDDATADGLAGRAAAFYNSLGASFDVAFGEFSDRDSAYMELIQDKGPQSWWVQEDFDRHARFINRFVTVTGKRMVLWQIPFGNRKMRAENNTTQHYQDNRVEWLLDEPGRTHLTSYINAGAIAFMFGAGNNEVTDARDAAGDGVTDPAPINGNTLLSYSADDDGGFFHNRAAAYYTTGAMPLPGGSSSPATSTPTPPGSGIATSTPTPPIPAPGSYTTSASISPGSVAPGGSTTITAAVTSGSAATVLVDVEVYTTTWTKVDQFFLDNQTFAAGQQRVFPFTWNVPSGAATGTYVVMIGLFHPGDWTPSYVWNSNAATISVAAAPATATPTPTLPPVTCSPRPAVQVNTVASGGRLQVSVTATGQNNRLLALQFTKTTNALVDVGGQVGRTGAFPVSLPGTSASTSFSVRRANAGTVTVALTVVDRCGGWTTFVGGGPSAF